MCVDVSTVIAGDVQSDILESTGFYICLSRFLAMHSVAMAMVVV